MSLNWRYKNNSSNHILSNFELKTCPSRQNWKFCFIKCPWILDRTNHLARKPTFTFVVKYALHTQLRFCYIQLWGRGGKAKRAPRVQRLAILESSWPKQQYSQQFGWHFDHFQTCATLIWDCINKNLIKSKLFSPKTLINIQFPCGLYRRLFCFKQDFTIQSILSPHTSKALHM